MLRFEALFLLALAIGATAIVAWAYNGAFDVLRAGAPLTADDLTALMILTSLSAFVAGFWAAFFTAAFPEQWAEEAGGQRVSKDASGATHVQMPNFGPLRALHLAALIAPFPVLLAVMMAGTSMSAVAVGWIFILAVVIGAPVLIMHRRRRGAFDVVVDSTSVQLPAMHGRKAAERISRADLENVHRGRLHRHGRRGGHFYRVSFRTKDGREPLLAEWRDQARAEALAKWLSQKLSLPYVDMA